jgi:DNA polymerase I-like protein with 3'-5' exonuclease and polymerase domains
MLVSYLCARRCAATALAEVALERFGVQAITDVEAGWGKDQEPPPGDAPLLACAAERVTLVRRFADAMRVVARADSLARVYREIEEPLLPVLLSMEQAGVRLDVEFLKRDVRRASAVR